MRTPPPSSFDGEKIKGFIGSLNWLTPSPAFLLLFVPLVGALSSSAAFLGGFFWRFPPGIIQFVDAKFVFSTFFGLAVKLTISLIFFRFALLLNLLFDKKQEKPFREIVRRFYSASIYALALGLSSFVFGWTYLGVHPSEFIACVLVVAFVALALFLPIERALSSLMAAARKIITNKSWESLDNNEYLELRRWISLSSIVILLASFICGELRMSQILTRGEVAEITYAIGANSSVKIVERDSVRLLGSTSVGVFKADYYGSKYDFYKEITFYFEIFESGKVYQAQRASRFLGFSRDGYYLINQD